MFWKYVKKNNFHFWLHYKNPTNIFFCRLIVKQVYQIFFPMRPFQNFRNASSAPLTPAIVKPHLSSLSLAQPSTFALSRTKCHRIVRRRRRLEIPLLFTIRSPSVLLYATLAAPFLSGIFGVFFLISGESRLDFSPLSSNFVATIGFGNFA